MSDQRRLLDDEQTRGLAQQLLRAGAEVRLSGERKDRLWQAIAAGLPPPGAGGEGPAAPPTPAPAALLAGGAKVGVALGVAALWAGAWFVGTSLSPGRPGPAAGEPPASLARPAAVAALTAAPSAAAPASLASSPEPRAPGASAAPPARGAAALPGPAAEPSGALAAGASAGLAASAAPAVDALGAGAPPAGPAASALPSPAEIAQQEHNNLLREEAAMTRRARDALRAGNAAEALRLLAGIQQKFGSRGKLWQEQEVLTIEALDRAGQRAQARVRAEDFLKAYPSSPLAKDVQPFSQ